MTNRQYLEDQDAEEPDDFIISLTAQVNSKFAVGLLKRFLFDYFYHTYWSGEGFQKI